MRLAGRCAALAVLGLWASAAPAFAAELGAREARVLGWLAAVAVLALVLGGGLALRGYRSFGLLAGLFLLGSAGRLMLLRGVWFPSLALKPLSIPVLIALVVLALQVAVTLHVLWRHRIELRAALGRAGTLVRLLGLLGGLALLSVSPTSYAANGQPAEYVAQILRGGVMSALQVATLGALLLVPGPRLLRLPRGAVPLAASAVALIASALLARYAFQNIPHVGDDLCYLFQAKTLASGHLTVPAPPEALREGLSYYLLDIQEGRWFCTTAPGYPLLLALGTLAGAAWLVNPILTALAVLIAYDLVRRASGQRALAALVAWLMACSPWLLATGASLMTQSTALCMALLGWWCLVRGGALREGARGQLSLPWAVAGGLAMGWVFTTRQYDGLVAGVVTGAALLTLRPLPWRAVFGYCAGCLITGLVYFSYNWAMTGNPLVAPLARYLQTEWPTTRNAFGFGPDLGPPAGSWQLLDFRAGHSLFEGTINTLQNMASLNLEALGWATGSALAVLLLLFRRWSRPGAAAWFLFALFAVTVGGLVFYWFAGSFYIGPRYWTIASLPVFYAAAAGLLALKDRLPAAAQARLWAVVALLCISGLCVFTAWRGAVKYYQFRGNYAGLRLEDFGTDLVFVSTEGDVQSALVLNDPFLPPDKPIFLRALGPEADAAAAALYPERGTSHVRLGPKGWVSEGQGGATESSQ
ncbi:hypothetical protein [Salipiger sp. PrR002]|uniref:hypothetical protein n=1 Tax=Salipiger sp. PrR002 TaxID=2706489 RepID=UPI0013BA9167|nr:hypothetical protein [Salipiger sp. PrR002]NDV99574.1 hypothetical protein [Salipiger sp. PrR002]NDW57220.1 hypothetical protein [Salipiger sp. PrR004]